MKIKDMTLVGLILGWCFFGAGEALAQYKSNKNSDTDEIAALRQRVAELEARQAEILALLHRLTDAHEVAEKPSSKVPEARPEVQPKKEEPEAKAIKWNELTVSGSHIRMYGLLRLDVTMDSARPNNPQVPQFIPSPDTVAGSAGNFSMYSKYSRLGFEFVGPQVKALGNARLSGKYEMDFLGAGGTEARPIARDRFAWMRLDWEKFSLQLGQDWDVVSPIKPTPNQQGDMGYAGNTGDRRPQLKAEFRQKAGSGTLTLQGSLGLTGSSDQEDLDGDGYRDGETSGRPNFQLRAAYSHSLWLKDKPATLGFGVITSRLRTVNPVFGRTVLHPRLLAADWILPLAPKLDLRGEFWEGRHVSDFRGGILQGLNGVTGREVRARGGWSELQLTPTKYFSLLGGYTTDDPVDGDLPNGARIRNGARYVGSRINVSNSFQIGIDYLRWLTDYKNQRRASDNRLALFFQYSF